MLRTVSAAVLELPLVLVKGNEHLSPERITAFELGYRTILFDKLGLNIELYYNDLYRLIENITHRDRLPFILSWDNALSAVARGVEIAADIPLASWWMLKLNYTFEEVKYKRVDHDIPRPPNINSIWDHIFHFQTAFPLTYRHTMSTTPNGTDCWATLISMIIFALI